jgi:hypothetical protein
MYPLPQSKDFRLGRPKDPDDLLGLSLSLEEFHLEDDIVECDQPESPTNILLWDDLSTVCSFPYRLHNLMVYSFH